MLLCILTIFGGKNEHSEEVFDRHRRNGRRLGRWGGCVFHLPAGTVAGRAECGGYNSEPGGKTKIYEFFQRDINKWEKRLKAAGIKPEVHRAGIFSDPDGDGMYCWVRFDTDLLNGIGYTGRDWANVTGNDTAFVAANGKKTRIAYMRYLAYARASEGFELERDKFGLPDTEGASKNQRSRAAPSLLFVMRNPSYAEDAETALRNAGIRVLEIYRSKDYDSKKRGWGRMRKTT